LKITFFVFVVVAVIYLFIIICLNIHDVQNGKKWMVN